MLQELLLSRRRPARTLQLGTDRALLASLRGLLLPLLLLVALLWAPCRLRAPSSTTLPWYLLLGATAWLRRPRRWALSLLLRLLRLWWPAGVAIPCLLWLGTPLILAQKHLLLPGQLTSGAWLVLLVLVLLVHAVGTT